MKVEIFTIRAITSIAGMHINKQVAEFLCLPLPSGIEIQSLGMLQTQF